MGRRCRPTCAPTWSSNLGADFGDVRVHDSGAAAESAAAVSAKAYTVGYDVVFNSGAYQPDSDEGRRTLAHELTHVVQQRSGPVDGTPTGDGVAVSHPQDRFEQEAEATASTLGPLTDVTAAAPSTAAVSTQRQPEEDGEAVQALQRQEARRGGRGAGADAAPPAAGGRRGDGGVAALATLAAR